MRVWNVEKFPSDRVSRRKNDSNQSSCSSLNLSRYLTLATVKIYNLRCSWNTFSFHRASGFSANDGRWHPICVTWRNSDGAWKFYKDGHLHNHSINFMRGHTIRTGGSLVLGQEQDRVGTGFDSSQSFVGLLTNVNVWNKELPPKEIQAFSKSCRYGVGNVYKWSDFIYGVKGKTALVIPSPCNGWTSAAATLCSNIMTLRKFR